MEELSAPRQLRSQGRKNGGPLSVPFSWLSHETHNFQFSMTPVSCIAHPEKLKWNLTGFTLCLKPGVPESSLGTVSPTTRICTRAVFPTAHEDGRRCALLLSAWLPGPLRSRDESGDVVPVGNCWLAKALDSWRHLGEGVGKM